MNFPEIISAVVNLIAIVFAITSHEAAHGAMAMVFGDDTAKNQGRVTLNPIKHIDPIGSVFLPGFLFLVHSPFLFGWAKPVPVNFNAFTSKRIGTICVAFAGPGTNILIAWLSGVLYHFTNNGHSITDAILINSFQINIFLAVFNLIPLLPLDGGRILGELLPGKLRESYAKIERYGMVIFMIIIFSPSLFKTIGIRFDPLSMILNPLYHAVSAIVLKLSGN